MAPGAADDRVLVSAERAFYKKHIQTFTCDVAIWNKVLDVVVGI